MQLDRTRIAIRERSYPDLLDLALWVIRAHALPLCVALVAGVAPFALLNAWLLGGLAYHDFELGFPFAYVFWMLVLVVWQIPLATAPVTAYLGKALFAERPPARDVAADLLRSLPQLLLFQGIVRGLLTLPIVTWFILFGSWPYLNEVILLDRNPLRAARPGQMTTYRRVVTLHRGYSGDLMVRWLGAAGVALLLGAALLLSFAMLRSLLVMHVDWNQWLTHGQVDMPMYTIYYPLTLWLVAGFLAVVRFLGYLDLRIRREGWEVELLLRAEGARLARRLT